MMMGQIGRLFLMFSLWTFLGLAGTAHAQTAASAAASAASSVSAPDANSGGEVAGDLDKLLADAPRMRFGAWLAMLVSLALGLLVYVHRRRRKYHWSRSAGYASAIGCFVVVFALMLSFLTSDRGKVCRSSPLNGGDAVFIDACRNARESAANFGGLVDVYRGLFVPDSNDSIRPMGPTDVQVISWLSGLLWVSLAYLALVPVAKKLFVST